MKKFLKIMSCAFAAALSLGTLAACGGPADDVLYVLSFKPEYNEIFEEVNQMNCRAGRKNCACISMRNGASRTLPGIPAW